MRALRGATEAEMLDRFWTAELAAASRWTQADVDERKRQWREREGLFHGFPDDVAWERVALTRDEVLAILYINWDWWLTSRLPRAPAGGARGLPRSLVPHRRVERVVKAPDAIASRP